MALVMATGQLIEGIKLARIVTEEGTPKTYNFDTAEEAEMKPIVEKGEDKVKRNKNTLLGRIRTEDLVSGLDLSFKQSTLIPEVVALVDGGTYDSVGKKYTAPVVGVPVVRTPFKLELYCANLDGDGDILNYVHFTFLHCKGTPVTYNIKDGDFFVPEMGLKSYPNIGEGPYTWEIVDALPTT